MRNKFKAAIYLVIPILLAYSLNTKFGSVPPILKFLNPFTGFWKNSVAIKQPKKSKLVLRNTKETVEIAFDDRMIPHIFAQNDHDAYYAQGYITARDRLWQMDFQTRYAAGRLSEVVGVKALELDRYQRRMGIIVNSRCVGHDHFPGLGILHHTLQRILCTIDHTHSSLITVQFQCFNTNDLR